MKNFVLLAGLLLAVVTGFSQRKRPARPMPDSVLGPVPVPSSPVFRGSLRPLSGPRPFNEVITEKAKTDSGLFRVHSVEDHFYFEIPDSLLGRDILVVNRIAKAAAGGRSQMMGYAGDQIGESVIQFLKGPNNRLFMKSIAYQEIANDTSRNGMYRSVLSSNLQPISASFDIKAYAKDTASSVIDITDYITGDNEIFFFQPAAKRSLSLGSMQSDKSYIENVRSFPMNVEIRTVKTYTRSPSILSSLGSGSGLGSLAASGPATYELNSSMVLLPKVPMKSRYYDPRVGYFSTGYIDFDANPQGVKKVSMITRWRLEPKPEDIEKYKRGELVEPKQPIVFFIDPATPRKWVPFLIQGINDWQVAFEQAGFKNAIVGKEAPDDPYWSIDDASHSAIVYKPSDIANASGPHVHDPRSGEIMETHINWYHNVMELVHNWYFVQTGAVDPKARKMHYDDSLMGQLIRFVSSHEVGHTLGLRHNYGSSSTVPVEKLRNKKWVEANGHTPSIMDYARFNYVAQPEDSISEKGLFPRIGEYDKWAIEWGYRWRPEFKTAAEEKAMLNKLIVDSLRANKRLFFGTEADPNDPRQQNEDLGDDPMKAGVYGIKNLKRILSNLLVWTKEENEGYDNTRTLYNEIILQLGRYMGHVSRNIGGITTTPRSVEETGTAYEFIPRSRQQEAMRFLQQQLFTTPSWLIDKKLYALAGVNAMSSITSLQDATLSRLMGMNTINKLLQFEAYNAGSAYTAVELFNDLRNGIWSELAVNKPVDIYRRNLQKTYVEKCIALVKPVDTQPVITFSGTSFGISPGTSRTSDVMSIVKGQMRSLMSALTRAIPAVSDESTKMHYQDVLDRMEVALDPRK